MATIIPISSNQKNRHTDRRRELKNKRTFRTLLGLIRTLLITGFAGGSFWLLTLPNWVIRDSKEIEVAGNKFLTVNEVRNLIPLSYPQPLLTLSTEKLTEKLETQAPFEDITINREILPPKITVKVVERQPVAIAFAPMVKTSKIIQIGYLDAQGILVPNQFYKSVKDKNTLPTFKITGIPDQYLPYWKNVYSLITQSEVKIKEINWQNPNNIIFHTELGIVYMGGNISQLTTQLMMLAKMKKLPQKVNPSEIILIDLSDPDFPSIKQKKPPETKKEPEK